MKPAYLSLGSNLGDRAAHIARAIGELAPAGIRVVRRSSLYVTEPVGLRRQNWFLNCVVEAETDLMPRQLLQALLRIERKFGRRRILPNGPRTMDLDILFYGSSIIRSRDLTIPHPRLQERRFVLVPLAELAPELRHPAIAATVSDLLAACPDSSQVRKRS